MIFLPISLNNDNLTFFLLQGPLINLNLKLIQSLSLGVLLLNLSHSFKNQWQKDKMVAKPLTALFTKELFVMAVKVWSMVSATNAAYVLTMTCVRIVKEKECIKNTTCSKLLHQCLLWWDMHFSLLYLSTHVMWCISSYHQQSYPH